MELFKKNLEENKNSRYYNTISKILFNDNYVDFLWLPSHINSGMFKNSNKSKNKKDSNNISSSCSSCSSCGGCGSSD